ncbi:MAG: monofunctional biosynthetic peptidoglycan transglycosylase [Bacteroidales bacterium]|nr:monofunctional biosynthetic peptidoglycan transglycosylase [Bacteroidales bacterium]
MSKIGSRIGRFFRKLIIWVVMVFLWSSLGAVCVYKYVPVRITPLMIIRLAEQHKAGKPLTLKHDWVPMEQINNSLALAVWASEDQRFLKHNGFDVKEIKLVLDSQKNNQKLRGASTISQQTAKNVFLWPKQSWLRKGLESYFTVLIEFIWDKERIMEVYLNSIEMGRGIYGAQSASREFFGHNAATLTAAESALIASALPNPLKRDCRKPNSYMKIRQKSIQYQMKLLGGRFPSKDEIAALREKEKARKRAKK